MRKMAWILITQDDDFLRVRKDDSVNTDKEPKTYSENESYETPT